MPLKSFRPITPTLRYKTVSDFADVTQGNEPVRRLTQSLHKPGGRNNKGHATSRYKGGGHRRRYRVIDFRRDKQDVPARVAGVEYDPNRSARIALLNYADGDKRYIVAPLGVKVGDTLVSGPGSDIVPGNALPIRNVPLVVAPARLVQALRQPAHRLVALRHVGEVRHGLVAQGRRDGPEALQRHGIGSSSPRPGRTARWSGRRPA